MTRGAATVQGCFSSSAKGAPLGFPLGDNRESTSDIYIYIYITLYV